jgi:hypothetical protein
MSGQQETNESILGGGVPGEESRGIDSGRINANNQEGANNETLLQQVDALTQLVARMATKFDELKASSGISKEQGAQEEISKEVEAKVIGRLQLRSLYGTKGGTSGGSSSQSGPLPSLTALHLC